MTKGFCELGCHLPTFQSLNAWSSDWDIACSSGNVAYIHGKGFPLDQVVAVTGLC